MRADEFLKRVEFEPNTGCWLWSGAASSQGYPQVSVSGVRRVGTHVALEIFKGSYVPKGMMACHKCDTPSCVNPDHLFVGTHQDNMDDMNAKGRHHRWNGARAGSGNPRAKLTPEIVASIRQDPRTNRAIAKQYGVGHVLVCYIKNGVHWK